MTRLAGGVGKLPCCGKSSVIWWRHPEQGNVGLLGRFNSVAVIGDIKAEQITCASESYKSGARKLLYESLPPGSF